MESKVSKVGVLVIWELAVGLAGGRGWLNFIPDWTLAVLLVAPVFIFVCYVLKRFVRSKPVISFIVFVIIGAVSGAIAWAIAYKADHRSGETPSAESSPKTDITPSAAPTIKGGIRIGGYSQLVIQQNIFPDTMHMESADHAKGKMSGNIFYQTGPTPTNPQVPDFVGKIWLVSMNYAETSEKPVIIFALFEMKNRGSPSVVDEFHAALKVGNKSYDIQRSQRLPQDFTILREDNTKIKMNESDMLYSKLAGGNPIVQGGRLAGWLMFVAKGAPIDPQKFEFTIFFSDVNGKEYSVTTSTDELSKTFVPFIPGVNNPFAATQPSPTSGKADPQH